MLRKSTEDWDLSAHRGHLLSLSNFPSDDSIKLESLVRLNLVITTKLGARVVTFALDGGKMSHSEEGVGALVKLCLMWSSFYQEIEGTSVDGVIIVACRYPDEDIQKKPETKQPPAPKSSYLELPFDNFFMLLAAAATRMRPTLDIPQFKREYDTSCGMEILY